MVVDENTALIHPRITEQATLQLVALPSSKVEYKVDTFVGVNRGGQKKSLSCFVC